MDRGCDFGSHVCYCCDGGVDFVSLDRTCDLYELGSVCCCLFDPSRNFIVLNRMYVMCVMLERFFMICL